MTVDLVTTYDDADGLAISSSRAVVTEVTVDSQFILGLDTDLQIADFEILTPPESWQPDADPANLCRDRAVGLEIVAPTAWLDGPADFICDPHREAVTIVLGVTESKIDCVRLSRELAAGVTPEGRILGFHLSTGIGDTRAPGHRTSAFSALGYREILLKRVGRCEGIVYPTSRNGATVHQRLRAQGSRLCMSARHALLGHQSQILELDSTVATMIAELGLEQEGDILAQHVALASGVSLLTGAAVRWD